MSDKIGVYRPALAPCGEEVPFRFTDPGFVRAVMALIDLRYELPTALDR